MSAAQLLLRVGQKTLWNPLHLGPNVLSAWWNADMHANSEYMTDDGAGLISSWSALNSKLAVTASTTARPTWSASAWTPNSQAGLTFDGTANCLVQTSFAVLPGGATAGEIWALITNSLSSAAFRSILRYGSSAGGATVRSIGNGNAAPNRLWVGEGATNLVATSGPLLDSSGHICGGYFSGTTEGGRIDGQDSSPATATIGSLNTGTGRLRIGASNATSPGLFWGGVMRHVFVTTILTSAQRLQMEGWLAWDGWSSAAANPLPVTHPFKYQAP